MFIFVSVFNSTSTTLYNLQQGPSLRIPKQNWSGQIFDGNSGLSWPTRLKNSCRTTGNCVSWKKIVILNYKLDSLDWKAASKYRQVPVTSNKTAVSFHKFLMVSISWSWRLYVINCNWKLCSKFQNWTRSWTKWFVIFSWWLKKNQNWKKNHLIDDITNWRWNNNFSGRMNM